MQQAKPNPLPLDSTVTGNYPRRGDIDAWLTVKDNTVFPSEPLTPADSLKDSAISPVSFQGSLSSPHRDPLQTKTFPSQPLTPLSGPNSAHESRPASPDLFTTNTSHNSKSLSPDSPAPLRPYSPSKQLRQRPSSTKPNPPNPPSTLPSLQVKIPTQIERNRRSPSGGSLREITSAGSERLKRQPSNASTSEEKKILGLFRRKSTKSISKKDITSPILERSEKLPTIPGVPIALLQPATSPQSPNVDGTGKRLPSGPAPPRPARPETMTDLMDHIKAKGTLLSSKPIEPTLSDLKPSLPTLEPQPVTQPASEETQPKDRNSDASVYNADNQIPEDRPSHSASGLPQISEEGDAPGSPTERIPPPSAWPSDRLRQSSGSRHAPSESASSSGSRFGFDDRSISSISSPPTSSASSFQFKESADDSKGVSSLSSEGSATSLRIPPSPRTANFSRPRGPTLTSSPLLQGPIPSPTSTIASSVGEESPQESIVSENHFEAPLHRESPTLQPTLQAVSYQRPSQKPAPQSFVKPPLPPMPEESATAPLVHRPNLSRSKSTASRGQCRGCKQEIMGRSIKAADGQLTGRWHRECKFSFSFSGFLIECF